MAVKTKIAKARAAANGKPVLQKSARHEHLRKGASVAAPPRLSEMPAGHAAVLARLKQRIAAAQNRAALAVNRHLIALYWEVGASIVERQTKAGWGNSVVERLAHDLRQAFPRLEGFSPRNI